MQGWKRYSIQEVAETQSGGTPNRSRSEYYNGTIPWLKTGELGSKYVYDTEEKISELAIKETSAKLIPENSVIVAMYGATIGKLSINKKEMASNQACCAIIPKKELYYEFLYYTLEFRKNDLIKMGSGAAQPNISQEIIRNYVIHVPEFKEQQKIADILSTWDKAIELKEKLIEQKKEQKKGLMQRLLTGKVRLPGFKGEWEKVGFDEVFVKISAKQHQITTLEYLNDGNIPVVDQGKEKIVAFTNNTEKLFKVPEEGVIVFGDHTREIKYIDFDFVVGADGTQILKTKKGFYTKFYYYHLLIQKIPNTGYNRHFKFLKEMVFKRPTIEEQKAISNVLSSLDLNIDLLKQEVSFLRQQKKGLMQLLLTGKVRVKC